MRNKAPLTHFICSHCQHSYESRYRYAGLAICYGCAAQHGLITLTSYHQQQTLAERAAHQQQLKQLLEQELSCRYAEEKAQLEAAFHQEKAQLQTELSQLQQSCQSLSEELQQLQQIRDEEQAQQQAQAEAEQHQAEQAIPQQHPLPLKDDDFVAIQQGEFTMGSPESEPGHFDNERQHSVSVEAFELMKAAVTFEQFDAYCQTAGILPPKDQGWGRQQRPVINVSYWDAVGFCDWLNQQQTQYRYRLPSEAEWEYACRAGTQSAYWYDDTPDKNKMHYGEESTRPTATLPANPWGLHEMHGNVWEWCASVYDEDYSGKEQQDASDQRGNLARRIIRGGSWYDLPEGCRSADRHGFIPDSKGPSIGFRLARAKI